MKENREVTFIKKRENSNECATVTYCVKQDVLNGVVLFTYIDKAHEVKVDLTEALENHIANGICIERNFHVYGLVTSKTTDDDKIVTMIQMDNEIAKKVNDSLQTHVAEFDAARDLIMAEIPSKYEYVGFMIIKNN